MGQEIERKFLVYGTEWRGEATSRVRYRQGYVAREGELTVRVRFAGEHAWLTIKGPTQGVVRAEFEYEIPVPDAQELLSSHCAGPLIEKTRYFVEFDGRIWEVDEFEGDNAGLIVAEVELEHAESRVSLPPWVGKEVSHLTRYFNAALVSYPYLKWTTDERAGR
tara:strand:+ start:55 stop:546 length:492 start_codon:yes stop_codon:yes gene_type:complete